MSGELSSDKMKREAEEAELLLRQHDENLDGDMKPVDAAQSVEEDIDAIPQDTVKAFSNNVEAPTGDDDNKKDKEGTVEYWKHKFEVMDGKHRAEVPRLADTVKSLKDENERLRSDIEKTRTSLASQIDELRNTSNTAKKGEAESALIETISDSIGPDAAKRLVDYVKSNIGVSDVPVNVSNKISALEKQVQESQETFRRSTRQTYNDGLRSAIPDIEVKMTDPAFLEWLSKPIPCSGGVRYGDRLKSSDDNNDLSGVLEVISSYWKNLKTGKAIAGLDIDELVQPQKSKASRVVQTTEKKIYTQKMVDDFYQKTRQGFYRGKEKDQKVIQDDIDQAMFEGRIR